MITENKEKHIMAVARLMKELAPKLNLDPGEMFTLGFLHDIGYEFDNDNHHLIGGKMLERQGYKYYREVLYHGMPDVSYSSIELDLLNYCVMHISSKGDYVIFEERLEDIKSRRGEQSIPYQNCVKTINNLKAKNLFNE